MPSPGLLFKMVALAAGVMATVSAGYLPSTLEPCPSMPPLPVDNSTCTILHNKDRTGFDLSNVRGNVKSCTDACEAASGCKTWTWNDYNGGTCWLKSFAGPLVDKAGVKATDCVLDGDDDSHDSHDTGDQKPLPGCGSALQDIDFVGNDIGNKPGNFNDCCKICNTFTGCKAYSWNAHNGGTCWLKKSVGQAIAKPGVISASTIKFSDPVCPFEFDTDFEGNDIGNKPAKNAGVCCTKCKAHKKCKAYSWSNFNGGTCWMKSAKGKTIAKIGVVSAKLL